MFLIVSLMVAITYSSTSSFIFWEYNNELFSRETASTLSLTSFSVSLESSIMAGSDDSGIVELETSSNACFVFGENSKVSLSSLNSLGLIDVACSQSSDKRASVLNGNLNVPNIEADRPLLTSGVAFLATGESLGATLGSGRPL